MKRFNAMVRKLVRRFRVTSNSNGSLLVEYMLTEGEHAFGVLDRVALAKMVEARLNAALREARP